MVAPLGMTSVALRLVDSIPLVKMVLGAKGKAQKVQEAMAPWEDTGMDRPILKGGRRDRITRIKRFLI